MLGLLKYKSSFPGLVIDIMHVGGMFLVVYSIELDLERTLISIRKLYEMN